MTEFVLWLASQDTFIQILYLGVMFAPVFFGILWIVEKYDK